MSETSWPRGLGLSSRLLCCWRPHRCSPSPLLSKHSLTRLHQQVTNHSTVVQYYGHLKLCKTYPWCTNNLTSVMQGLFGARLSWERLCWAGVDKTRKASHRSCQRRPLTQNKTNHETGACLLPGRKFLYIVSILCQQSIAVLVWWHSQHSHMAVSVIQFQWAAHLSHYRLLNSQAHSLPSVELRLWFITFALSSFGALLLSGSHLSKKLLRWPWTLYNLYSWCIIQY